jgi:hypothetical protein
MLRSSPLARVFRYVVELRDGGARLDTRNLILLGW